MTSPILSWKHYLCGTECDGILSDSLVEREKDSLSAGVLTSLSQEKFDVEKSILKIVSKHSSDWSIDGSIEFYTNERAPTFSF